MPSASPRRTHQPVEVVDLAVLAARQVLRGRRILAGHGARQALHRRPARRPGTCTPSARATARHSSTTSRITSRHARALHQPAIGQLRDGRQRVVGAVDDELGPQRAAHVVGDLGRHAGGDQHLRHLVAGARRLDHQLAAAVVPARGRGRPSRSPRRPRRRRLPAAARVRSRSALSTPFCRREHQRVGRQVRPQIAAPALSVSVDLTQNSTRSAPAAALASVLAASGTCSSKDCVSSRRPVPFDGLARAPAGRSGPPRARRAPACRRSSSRRRQRPSRRSS